jgi:hypothetical protein
MVIFFFRAVWFHGISSDAVWFLRQEMAASLQQRGKKSARRDQVHQLSLTLALKARPGPLKNQSLGARTHARRTPAPAPPVGWGWGKKCARVALTSPHRLQSDDEPNT